MLTASSFSGSLLWSNGASTTSITVISAGTYTLTQQVNGCTSPAGSGTAAPVTALAAPAVTVVNNCGSSILTASGYTGSLMWSNGATTESITVTAAGTYTVTQKINGCISPAGSGTAAPGTAPAAPAVTVVNNCGNSTLTASGYTGTLLWSNGATTASITVTSAGTYTLTQKVNGCISPGGSGTAAPGTAPAAPGVTVVNNCGNSTLTASGYTGTLLWSNGATTASITVTAAGTYTVTQKVNGCTSPAGSAIAAPRTPVGPTVSVVQPACNVATGTIKVTSSTAGSTLSLDGGAFAAYPAGGYVVAGGSHNLRIKDAGGCISTTTNVTVNGQPGTPAAPTVMVTQPICTVSTGTIAVTSSTAGLTFSLDGGPFAAYPAGQYNVAVGSHNLRAQNASGCISAATTVTINAAIGSGYVVYVSLDASFNENNTIIGNVGNTYNGTDGGKNVEFKKYDILDPYKVMSKFITVDLPSAVNKKTFSPASGGPVVTFLPYTGSGLQDSWNQTINGTVPSGNWDNLTIKKNVKAIITGNNYGSVTIEEGATATFTATNINMKKLDVRKGTTTNLTQVNFANPATVRIKEDVNKVDDYTRVNVGGPKVVFHISSGRKFTVDGKDIKITVDVHSPDGTLEVKGGPDITMTGLYTVKEMKGSAKFVTWQGVNVCPPVAQRGTLYTNVKVSSELNDETNFKVTVLQNPSTDYFTLIVKGKDLTTPVSVRVLDMNGRVLSTHKTGINSSLKVGGSRWASGTYFAEVIQGGQHSVVKMIKVN